MNDHIKTPSSQRFQRPDQDIFPTPDDVTGHGFRGNADAESAEGDDDTEGHGFSSGPRELGGR